MKKIVLFWVLLLSFCELYPQSLAEKAENGDRQAQYELALLYLKGQSVKKDSMAAADLLLSSAGGGFCIPGHIFTCLVSYDKSATNKQAESKLLELCSLSNSPKVHYFLALYGFLCFAKEEYSKAEMYFKRAEKNGSCIAMAGLGLMYFYSLANSPQGFSWYDKKHDDLWYEDSEKYYVNNKVLGLESYKFDDNSKILEYLKNKKWSENDNVSYWLEQAIDCDLGAFKFGIMEYNLYDHLLFVYVDGVGNRKNLSEATKIAQLYCKDKNIEDTYFAERTFDIVREEIGLDQNLFDVFKDLYTHFKGQYAPNYRILRISASGLGEWYYKGYGSQKPNYNLAFDYLSEAAILGDCSAMRLLAACYRYGRGVGVNENRDKEWVKKAKDCGDQKAKEIEERRNR